MSRVIGPLSQTPSRLSEGLAVGEGDRVGALVAVGVGVGGMDGDGVAMADTEAVRAVVDVGAGVGDGGMVELHAPSNRAMSTE